MARYDLYPAERGYLLDVQNDLLMGLNSRLVIPLLPIDIAPSPQRRLNPSFEIEGAEYRLVTQYLSAIRQSQLGKPIGNLKSHQATISAAIDMIFLGF